jgi:Na+/serine symporter
MMQSTFAEKFFGGNLVLRIAIGAIGIVAGVLLAYTWPDAASSAMLAICSLRH